VQGFGAVGRHAARFLAGKGARLIAASNTRGAVYDPAGLNIGRLQALKAEGKSVIDLKEVKRISADEIVAISCDIWVPAARPDVIRESNVEALRTRLVLQGANIPATLGAERRMHERGILSIPDFIANAGGVIAAALEYRGGTENAAFDAIAEKIAANTRAVLENGNREAHAAAGGGGGACPRTYRTGDGRKALAGLNSVGWRGGVTRVTLRVRRR
jgi:glutamate dehydrogenase (NAD(P)+)